MSGRYTPLHIYGPNSTKPELGTAAFVENLKKTYAWDNVTRSGTLPVAGGKIIAHEFDYKQENKVVYEENGVRITSFPAVHSYDGSVSYRLDWKGLSFVFGGDSRPNTPDLHYPPRPSAAYATAERAEGNKNDRAPDKWYMGRFQASAASEEVTA